MNEGLAERLLRRVKVDANGCWIWQGRLSARGYASIRVDRSWSTSAHRASYFLAHGYVENNLDIDHLCRVTSCVNPDHLEAVTHRENILRGDTFAARHAAKTHCPKGHPLSKNNLVEYDLKKGMRKCKTCTYARNESRRKRTRAAKRSEREGVSLTDG